MSKFTNENDGIGWIPLLKREIIFFTAVTCAASEYNVVDPVCTVAGKRNDVFHMQRRLDTSATPRTTVILLIKAQLELFRIEKTWRSFFPRASSALKLLHFETIVFAPLRTLSTFFFFMCLIPSRHLYTIGLPVALIRGGFAFALTLFIFGCPFSLPKSFVFTLFRRHFCIIVRRFIGVVFSPLTRITLFAVFAIGLIAIPLFSFIKFRKRLFQATFAAFFSACNVGTHLQSHFLDSGIMPLYCMSLFE
jgi:hypothetical protein